MHDDGDFTSSSTNLPSGENVFTPRSYSLRVKYIVSLYIGQLLCDLRVVAVEASPNTKSGELTQLICAIIT
jgi:hypothetical protein